MRKQLEVDIKGCMNQDLAAVIKDLMEKHNALVAEHNAVLAALDADAVGGADYVANLTSTNTISID